MQQNKLRYDWFINEPKNSCLRDYPCIALNITDRFEDFFHEEIRAWNKVLEDQLPASMQAV